MKPQIRQSAATSLARPGGPPLSQQRGRCSWPALAAITVLVSLGAGLRIHGLSASTIGHIEIYVPGIELPYELSDPRPRHTIGAILTGTVAAEPHPPGYYFFMLGWTRLFGTGVDALRLPSVLFGVGSIVLLYLLGVREADRPTALLAAALLALNGHSIFWSQIAKMYAMAVFLGLLSTFCLVAAWAASGRQRLLLLVLYAAATLAGLGTVVYFWPLFLTQLLWSIRGRWAERSSVSDIFRVQILVFVLASPLWALAAFQGRRPSYLETGIWDGLQQFLAFGFIFEPDDFAVPPTSVPSIISTGAALLGAFLLAVRLRFSPTRMPGQPGSIRLPTFLTVISAVAATGAIFAFAVVARSQDPSRTRYIAACGVIPVMLAGLDVLLQRRWNTVQQWGTASNRRLPRLSGAEANSLSLLLAIVPVSLIGAVSTVTPLFVSSGVMLVTPYLVLTLAGGLTWLCGHRQRAVAAAGVLLVLVVLAAHIFSTTYAKNRVHHPLDYKGLAAQWAPKVRESDVIFTQRHWAFTPIFYYMPEKRYQFVGTGYEDAARNSTTGRVWVLAAEDMPVPPEVTRALADYRPSETIEALRLRAVLYERPGTAAGH